jgi:uncharacterized protein
MIVLDANILLYAYDTTSAHHAVARAWIEQVLSSGAAVGIPWQTAAAFLRVATNPRLPGERFTIEQAVGVVEQWLELPNVKPLSPGENHWPLLRQMIVDGQTRGPLITDAQLAALTIECGGVLHTTDRDFTRFPGLRWTNPFA